MSLYVPDEVTIEPAAAEFLLDFREACDERRRKQTDEMVEGSTGRTAEQAKRIALALAIALAAAVCILGGIVLGFLNGLVIAKGRIAPFVATLGTLAANVQPAYAQRGARYPESYLRYSGDPVKREDAASMMPGSASAVGPPFLAITVMLPASSRIGCASAATQNGRPSLA